jgi:hypothetical protein
MIAKKRSKKIFLNPQAGLNVDVSPRIISRRKVNSSLSASDEILEIEFGCFVDQRKIIEEKISEIKIFTSPVSLSSLKKRKSVLSPAIVKRPNPAGLDGNQIKSSDLLDLPPAGSQKRKIGSRKQDDLEKSQIRSNNRRKSLGSDASRDRANFINVVNDIDKISQDLNKIKNSSLKFLTKINVNQLLASARIKNIQNFKQTDDELFGTKEIFSVEPELNLKGRNIKRIEKRVSLPVEQLAHLSPASEFNFRNAYFSKINMGVDPLASFQYSDDFSSLQESIKGIALIDKSPSDHLRETFKKIIQEEIDKRGEIGNLRIIKKRLSRRSEIYKGTFRILRSKLREIGQEDNVNLIYYAYDARGIKIDSFGQALNLRSLLSSDEEPPLDFNVSVARSHKGNIITKINNKEKIPARYNLYQKTFTRSQNFQRKNFHEILEDLSIGPAASVSLTNGSRQSRSSLEITKTKTVFHRVTSNFKNKEISNTRASSVTGNKSLSKKMTCAVYAKSVDERVEVNIANLSDDVRAVLPVKRKATGRRGNNFTPLRVEVGSTLDENSKVFINPEEIIDNPTLTFFDDDLQEGQIYEYAAMLYGKNGHPQLSSSRFLEKVSERESQVIADVRVTSSRGGKDNRGENIIENNFDVDLIRSESDVDKILNSLFGDNRQLFQEDLSSIKDASNLIYGVRVHKINTITGEFSFVGSYRANTKSSPEDQPNTDLPRLYKVSFSDSSAAGQQTIYKFNPYIIPPSQILDKVFDTLQNLVKNNNRSALPINKFLVSKQKIINQNVVSKIGTKYASIQGRKGAISSAKSFAEKRRNDLFLEGLTGDIVYTPVGQFNGSAQFLDMSLRSKNISLLNIFEQNDSSNFIPKNLVEVDFSVGEEDNIVDFYVILRRENNSKRIIIDGAIHSKDINEDQLFSSYRYLSKVKTSVGLLSYYVVPVSKLGTRGQIISLGKIILRGS